MQQNPTLDYRRDIDGLRAIAILSVISFHVFPEWVTGGFVGVDIFFVICGYLITSILLKGFAANRFGFFDFYIRRIKRIFPALILVLVTCYVLGWYLLLGTEFIQLGKHTAAGAGFVSNLLSAADEGYFNAAAESK